MRRRLRALRILWSWRRVAWTASAWDEFQMTITRLPQPPVRGVTTTTTTGRPDT